MAIYHCDVELHNGRIMHSGVHAGPDKYSKRRFLLMSTEEHSEVGNDITSLRHDSYSPLCLSALSSCESLCDYI